MAIGRLSSRAQPWCLRPVALRTLLSVSLLSLRAALSRVPPIADPRCRWCARYR